MKLTFFLAIVFLSATTFAFCDTIDNWQIYLNDQVIGKFNQHTKLPEITTSFKFTDTISIRYNQCSGRTNTVLVFCDAGRGDSVIAWNDGNSYSDQSEIMLMKTPYDSAYWENAYEGSGTVKMSMQEVYGISSGSKGEPLRFYYISKSWIDKKFGDVLLFSLKLIPPVLHYSLKGTVSDMAKNSISGVDIYLVRGNDTLGCTTSTADGTYAFPDSLLNEKALYELKGMNRLYPLRGIKFDLRELNYSQDFVIDIYFPRRMVCYAANAYFDPEEYREIHDFDAELLREFLKEYDNICLEFSLTQLKGESRRLGEKRLETFRELLEANGVNPGQYTISNKQYTYSNEPDSLNELPVRPAILGKVVSIEGDCLQNGTHE